LYKLIVAAALFTCGLAASFAVETQESLFTLDMNYARTAVANNGVGLGFGYERSILDHLALKGGVGNMTFLTSEEDLYCSTVGVSLDAHYYPLSSDLRRLYTGLGCSTDFLNYFGSASVRDKESDTIIYLDTVVGWKQRVARWLLLDFNFGYNVILSNASNYPDFDKYGKAGFRPSIVAKLFLRQKGE